jgi:hypothetical protein
VVAALACSIAVAQTAIRATGLRVPSLAGGLARADPALVDKVVCFRNAVAVSLASGGTAGDVDWAVFVRVGSRWHALKAAGGYKLGLFSKDRDLEVVQPVYRRNDPNCCPTGGFDRALYTVTDGKLVTRRQWHTRTFVTP